MKTKEVKIPCFAQDVVTLITIAAERLNDMDKTDRAAARRALVQFADETRDEERDFLMRAALAITLSYEGA